MLTMSISDTFPLSHGWPYESAVNPQQTFPLIDQNLATDPWLNRQKLLQYNIVPLEVFERAAEQIKITYQYVY